jgi:hypothetical protein
MRFPDASRSGSMNASLGLADRTGITDPAGIDAKGGFFLATRSLEKPTTLFIPHGREIPYIQVRALARASLKRDIQRCPGVQL